MSDEIYKPDSDDEYQYSDNETAVVYKGEKKGEAKSVLAQRRIWLAVAIIVIGVVGYKLSGLFSGKQTKFPDKIATLPSVDQVAPKQGANPKLVAGLPSAITPPGEISKPQANTNNPFLLDQRLSSVEQHNKEDSMQINRLENRINAMNSDFSQVRDQLDQLQRELRAVSGQLNSLQQKMPGQTEQKKPAAKSQKPAAKVTYPTYHVQAVLPGRAWLVRNNDFATLTVAVGDVLPGYGTIVNINPTRASVITSTGYTIPYKPD